MRSATGPARLGGARSPWPLGASCHQCSTTVAQRPRLRRTNERHAQHDFETQEVCRILGPIDRNWSSAFLRNLRFKKRGPHRRRWNQRDLVIVLIPNSENRMGLPRVCLCRPPQEIDSPGGNRCVKRGHGGGDGHGARSLSGPAGSPSVRPVGGVASCIAVIECASRWPRSRSRPRSRSAPGSGCIADR
jgi:hypothetical protein